MLFGVHQANGLEIILVARHQLIYIVADVHLEARDIEPAEDNIAGRNGIMPTTQGHQIW